MRNEPVRRDSTSRPPAGRGPARGEGRGEGGPRKVFRKKRICRYCADAKLTIDYKDARVLRSFLTERGKILPRRMSGACAKHQRGIAIAIKRARNLAILPFTAFLMERSFD